MKEINLDKIKFIYAYMKFLATNNNYVLDQINVEKHYYSIISIIKKDEIYSNISFNNDLTEELYSFVMCGYLSPFKNDNSLFHILKYKENYEIDDYINSMIKKLLEIDIIASQYEDLEVIISNPNGKYNILIGNVGDKKVAWDIFTDGEVRKGNIQLIKGSNVVKNPEDNSNIRLDNLSRERVIVSDSSFVIKQGLIDDNVILNTLYTSIENIDNISEIAKQYCKKRI